MAIPAKRFKFLDEETNLSISDFITSSSSSLLNSPNNELKEIAGGFQEFLNNGSQTTEQAKSFIDETLREVKGAAGSLKDISKFSPKDLDKMIASTLPGNAMVQSAFNQLSASCKTQALSHNGLGKPWDPVIDCNGNKRKAGGSGACNNGQFGDVLNKVTGGEYKSGYNDMNRTLRNLMALSSYGFKMNMCGVFGALSKNVDLNVIGRAASGLLSEVANTGNVLGFMDIANNASGTFPLLENPSGVSGIFENFSLPVDVVDHDLPGFSDRFTGAAELLDADWASSDYDDFLSTACIGQYNDELDSMFTGKMMNNVFTEDSLDSLHADDFTFMTVAEKSYNFKLPDSFSI